MSRRTGIRMTDTTATGPFRVRSSGERLEDFRMAGRRRRDPLRRGVPGNGGPRGALSPTARRGRARGDPRAGGARPRGAAAGDDPRRGGPRVCRRSSRNAGTPWKESPSSALRASWRARGRDATGGFEITAALGREWRPAALAAGGEPDHGAGFGSGTGPRGGGFGAGEARAVAASPSSDCGCGRRPRSGGNRASRGSSLPAARRAALALVGLAVVAARGLAERQRREVAEAESQRLATVARAGAGLAHRLRNPLAVVKGTAQLLEGASREGERERVDADRRGERADGDDPLAPSRLRAAPRAAADGVRPRGARPRRGLARAAGPTFAPRRRCRSAPTGSTSRRCSRSSSRTRARSIRRERIEVDRPACRERPPSLEVADRGPGLELDPASAFEPYVTSRPDGTGLGLAIVKALAVANGGSAALAPRPGGGCVASLSLPAAEA